ncbi:MAG: ATP-binding protein, partial [Lachnospiraceae bacterium]|nr:ATP-binding protein [Lachnospiraceae bacterium]
KIHSVAGTLDRTKGLISVRPFRSPHHTVSANALVGGGTFPRPGEMSLAHNGVLFLDELPEFSKMTLEVMRQPLEDRKVVISRVHGSYVFPTRVMLVAAMNPCKCGFFPDRNKCRCTEAEVRQYLSKISRPLLDRIDIFAEVPRIGAEALNSMKPGMSSEELKEGVIRAWEAEKRRYLKEPFLFNSDLEGASLRKYCEISCSGRDILKEAMEKLNLSARAHDRILKVARTIADFEGTEEIRDVHLTEAISYRSLNDKFWGGI